MTARKCIFCGAKATLLCDHWIGWERKRGAMGLVPPSLIDSISTALQGATN